MSFIILAAWLSSVPSYAQLYAPEIKVQNTNGLIGINKTSPAGQLDMYLGSQYSLTLGKNTKGIGNFGSITFRNTSGSFKHSALWLTDWGGYGGIVAGITNRPRYNSSSNESDNKGIYFVPGMNLTEVGNKTNGNWDDWKATVAIREQGVTIAKLNNRNVAPLLVPGTDYSLRVQGGLYVTGQVHANSQLVHSDRRMKENIKEYKGGLSVIKNINTVSYDYRAEAADSASRKNRVGVIAQELQQIAPFLVGSTKSTGKEEMLAVKVSDLCFVMLNAIKEQQTVIEELQAEIKNK